MNRALVEAARSGDEEAFASTDVVYVVDVPGDRFVVVARHNWNSIRAEVGKLEGIVRDIQIEDAGRGSPSPSTP